MNEPVYNCGCFWWMHDTVNTCDLYLPDRKPAGEECPLVADCRRRDAHRRLVREVEECRRHGLSLNRYPREIVRYDPVAGSTIYTTATGAQMTYQQAMQDAGWRGLLVDQCQFCLPVTQTRQGGEMPYTI